MNKKIIPALILCSMLSVGSVFAKAGIGIGPQWNGASGPGITFSFKDKMVLNIGFPYGGWYYYGMGIGIGFDYLIGQYTITDFGSEGVVDLGWHWGLGGAVNMFFSGYGYYRDFSGNLKTYDNSFGIGIGFVPDIGLDLGVNATDALRLNFFLQYQPVIGIIINRPGIGGTPFWFEPWSFAAGLRFHF